MPDETNTPHSEDRRPLAPRPLLDRHLDAVHAIASEQLLASLLPAIEVAWADGVVQDREREVVFELAKECGLDQDAAAMARVHAWLDTPPNKQESREALVRLRELGRQRGRAALVEIFEGARAVARADGGVLGLGSVNADERRAIEWLETVLQSEWDERETRPDGLSPLIGVLEVFRELLVGRTKADTTHREVIPRGEHSMWPQPSPWGADRFPPAVLGVPHSEYLEYMEVIVGRYLRSLEDGWWDAICHAAMHPGVATLCDEELGALVLSAPFGRFLCPSFDPPDLASFGELVEEAARVGTPYKVDMRHLGACVALPGMYLASSVGLFALRGEELVTIAIEVDGRVFVPDQSESWARARYFLVQGCAVTVVLGAHPLLHFPMDSVIGVTRSIVPPRHPLARVIETHAWLHLPLDYGVTYNERSVAHNHQREIYTPFPTRRDDIFQHLVSEFFVGTPGNSARPSYVYPMGPPSFPGRYAEFLACYYETLLSFCRRVAAAIAPDDPVVAAWGAALHELLPGFPSAEALREGEVLARALCGFVHTVSVWHSADHHTYGQWPVNKIPQRLRVPPPTGDDEPVPLARWIRADDIVRQEISRRLFYSAHTVRNILSVDYGFEQPELVAAVQELHAALRECDRRQPIRYIALDDIACSLQF